MKLWRIVLAVLLPLAILAPVPATAGTGLGISVSFDRAEQTDAESAGSIWAGGEQGTSLTRTIRVRSSSDDTAQALEFIVYDQIVENDEKVTDYGKESKVTPWISFSPENAVVQPGEEAVVTMTINIPAAADDESINLILRVMAGSAGEIDQSVDENVGVQAVIGSKIAIDSSFWLGVGDAMDLMPNFEILGVDGVLLNETRYMRIFFENTGLVPLALSGRFQLSDPAFQDLVYEPVDFRVRSIEAGDLGFVDVELPQDTVDGFYRSFVTAQHSGVRKTEVFEGNIVFDDPSLLTIPELLWRIGLFVVAGIGLVIGVRLIRTPREPKEPRVPKQPRTPRPPKEPRARRDIRIPSIKIEPRAPREPKRKEAQQTPESSLTNLLKTSTSTSSLSSEFYSPAPTKSRRQKTVEEPYVPYVFYKPSWESPTSTEPESQKEPVETLTTPKNPQVAKASPDKNSKSTSPKKKTGAAPRASSKKPAGSTSNQAKTKASAPKSKPARAKTSTAKPKKES
jgi:hypothetical protein